MEFLGDMAMIMGFVSLMRTSEDTLFAIVGAVLLLAGLIILI